MEKKGMCQVLTRCEIGEVGLLGRGWKMVSEISLIFSSMQNNPQFAPISECTGIFLCFLDSKKNIDAIKVRSLNIN